MPPSSGRGPGGLPGGTTTIAIVLILVVPSLLLIGLCLARKTPFFQYLRRQTRAITPTRKRLPGAAGPESLQSIPVIKYDTKLFTAKEDLEAGNVKLEANPSKASPFGHRLRWSSMSGFGRFRASLSWPRERNMSSPARQDLSLSSEVSSSELPAKTLAMQAWYVAPGYSHS